MSAGTLAQNATARVVGDEGVSQACAGLAGDGATLVEAGEGDCLTPGNQLEIDAANFDLSQVTVAEGEALEPFASELDAALVGPVREQVLDAVDDDVADALEQVGDPAVVLDLGAVEGSCSSDASGATGDASLAGAGLFTTLPEQGRVDLVSFPVNPPPNTKVLTDLEVVVDTFNAALQEQLSTGLDGALEDLGPLADDAFERSTPTSSASSRRSWRRSRRTCSTSPSTSRCAPASGRSRSPRSTCTPSPPRTRPPAPTCCRHASARSPVTPRPVPVVRVLPRARAVPVDPTDRS